MSLISNLYLLFSLMIARQNALWFLRSACKCSMQQYRILRQPEQFRSVTPSTDSWTPHLPQFWLLVIDLVKPNGRTQSFESCGNNFINFRLVSFIFFDYCSTKRFVILSICVQMFNATIPCSSATWTIQKFNTFNGFVDSTFSTILIVGNRLSIS